MRRGVTGFWALLLFQAKERITRKQKSGRTSAESLTPRGRSSRPHDKEMSMITLAPTEALAGKPVKLIILGENLPVREDLVVEFSSTWWSTGVVPDVQHHGCAVQVFTPALDVEIEQRMRVEVKLVNTNTGEESGAKDFFFLPNKETKDKPRMDEEAKTVIEADKIEEFNPNVTFVAERNTDHEKSNEIKTNGKKVEDTGKDSRQTTGGKSRTIKESSPSKVTVPLDMRALYNIIYVYLIFTPADQHFCLPA